MASSVMGYLRGGYTLSFLYFCFNDWPTSRFLVILPQSLFRSLLQTKVSSQSFASPNQKLNITFHVNIKSKCIAKRHRVRSGTFSSYFTAICLWFKFNAIPIVVLTFRLLQHRHDFCLDQIIFNWIIHVIKCSVFTPVSPIKTKFLGPYNIQPVSMPFQKTLPVSFSYFCFPVLFSNTTTFMFEWI